MKGSTDSAVKIRHFWAQESDMACIEYLKSGASVCRSSFNWLLEKPLVVSIIMIGRVRYVWNAETQYEMARVMNSVLTVFCTSIKTGGVSCDG